MFRGDCLGRAIPELASKQCPPVRGFGGQPLLRHKDRRRSDFQKRFVKPGPVVPSKSQQPPVPRLGSEPIKEANSKRTAVSIIGPPLSAKFGPELAFMLFKVSERAFVVKEAFLCAVGRLASGAKFGNKGALVCDDLAGPCQSRGRCDQKRVTAWHCGTPARERKNPASSPAPRRPTQQPTSIGRAVTAVVCGTTATAGIVEYPRRPSRVKHGPASGCYCRPKNCSFPPRAAHST
jgi:hypothetical protein